MWPFRKKTPDLPPAPPFESVLCIPGDWNTDLEVKLSLVKATEGEYIAAGGVLLNVESNCHFRFEVCERQEEMQSAFEVAGRVTGMSDESLEAIGRHKLVVYIYGPGGSLAAAAQMAFAAAALLKAGGTGVKVETTGKAFDKAKWLTLTGNFQEHHVYELFVLDSISDEGTTFSCGMQNLGLKDTIVSGLPFQKAADLIRIFGYYQVVDKPHILPNQTFTPLIDSNLYRITEETNPPYKDVALFGNPYGMWRLTLE